MQGNEEVYTPQQHLNPVAQKRLASALAQVGHNEDDEVQDKNAMKMYGNTTNNTKRKKSPSTSRHSVSGNGVDYDEDDDDLEHAKWWGKKALKVLIWVLVFLLGVTCFAVFTGFLGEAVKAYHDVAFQRGAAASKLRNECCLYLKRTLPPEHEAKVGADCQAYANDMCRPAEIVLAEYWIVQFFRQLAYAYSLCSEGSCYQVLMNLTFTGTGILMGTYKFLSWVSWIFNPFSDRRMY